jgi:hypothetical protein
MNKIKYHGRIILRYCLLNWQLKYKSSPVPSLAKDHKKTRSKKEGAMDTYCRKVRKVARFWSHMSLDHVR